MKTPFSVPLGMSTKESDIEVSEFREQIANFSLENNTDGRMAGMIQSIVLDELAIQHNKNDKPLGMLDKLVMKNAIEKI